MLLQRVRQSIQCSVCVLVLSVLHKVFMVSRIRSSTDVFLIFPARCSSSVVSGTTRPRHAVSSAKSPSLAGRSTLFLFGQAKPLQVEAVPVVELDAFLFQQALLNGIASIAGGGVRHLAPRVDDAMPRNIGCRVEVLEYAADKAGPPWQSGHRGDLTIRGHPAFGNAADYSANRCGSFVTLGWGSVEQLALLRHRRLSSIPVVIRMGSRLAWSPGFDRGIPRTMHYARSQRGLLISTSQICAAGYAHEPQWASTRHTDRLRRQPKRLRERAAHPLRVTACAGLCIRWRVGGNRRYRPPSVQQTPLRGTAVRHTSPSTS